MESALNQAHRLERKADALLANFNFDEAINCHQKIAELLLQAMQLTKADKALESLQLQHDYQIRRQAVIRYKQILLARVRAMSKQMAKITSIEQPDIKQSVSMAKMADIQNAIYRNIQENDSLLRGLISGTAAAVPSPDAVIQSATKAPKDDKTIIEELRINNEELRRFVDELITELDVSRNDNKRLKMEIADLKVKISRYESDRRKLMREADSPFVFSPNGELSPEGLRIVPPLAPLELPNFDFNKFASTSESSSDSQTVL